MPYEALEAYAKRSLDLGVQNGYFRKIVTG